jgi:hypothetical protein
LIFDEKAYKFSKSICHRQGGIIEDYEERMTGDIEWLEYQGHHPLGRKVSSSLGMIKGVPHKLFGTRM